MPRWTPGGPAARSCTTPTGCRRRRARESTSAAIWPPSSAPTGSPSSATSSASLSASLELRLQGEVEAELVELAELAGQEVVGALAHQPGLVRVARIIDVGQRGERLGEVEPADELERELRQH